MMKKVSYSVVTSKGNKELHCSLCNTQSDLSSFICESGHVICHRCRNSEIRLPNNKTKKSQSLASGDHYEAHNLFNNDDSALCRCNSGSSHLIHCNYTSKERNSTSKNVCSAMNIMTSIHYKNVNYKDSKSSIATNRNFQNLELCDGNYTASSRPIVCPVTECSKIVTIESIMLHFYFDHSKVPKIVLNVEPCEIYLKPQKITSKTQCLALFLLSQLRKNGLIDQRIEFNTLYCNKESKLFVLMAVKFQPHYPTFYNSEMVFKSKATKSTQTGKNYDNNFEVSKICLRKCNNDYKTCISSLTIDDNEVLLLWLYKLDEEEQIYSITLYREDKKQGYSYTGNAIYIRDKQEPASMFNKSECLAVKGTAINGLVNTEKQINVTVNVMH